MSGTDVDRELVAQAEAWRDDDPDPETRAELGELLDAVARRGDGAEALAELRDRFDGELEFGTAGLRGVMAAGPNRMNTAVVLRTTAGLAAYLADQGLGGQPVVVGQDARHRSDRFAFAAAQVLAEAGFPVHLADRPVPTPLLAFAVRHLGCCAGVQVTASHNPPADNGYKVYLGDGAQIVPPADHDIAAHIAGAGPAADLASAAAVAIGDRRITTLGDDVVDAYVAGALATALHTDRRDARVVYTPLHGVGGDLVARVFGTAGFAPLDVVPQQAEPDPDFPTVAFPNPEEPGALDLALDLARSAGADVVIANDPDADRLAVAVPAPDGWRLLTGDEIGILLADWLLSQTDGADRLVVTTIVSSSMLGKLAAARGVGYAETLTGFKWIARAAEDRPDLRFTYGYEEALGSCVGTLVRDKDGITAALAFAELVAVEKAGGRSVLDRLRDLALELGEHTTRQRSFVVAGEGAGIVERLAGHPPRAIAGHPVTEVEDLRRGERLPPTDGVILRGDGVRLIVRPSGTEPKLKCYAEAIGPGGAETIRRLLDECARLVS